MQRKPLFQSAILFAGLVLVGALLQLVRGDLYWGGFLAIASFYAVMFYLGASTSTDRSKQIEETLLAGRSLPLGVALLTMTATWVGGGFINGTAESVASSGLVWAQAPWGYALSLIIGGLIFAGPMRRLNFTTMLDPLEDRFGKRMAGLLYIPALLGEVFWTAAILSALGTTFGFILDIDFSVSIILSAFVAILYTSMGGLRAVARTDVLQLIILFVGLTVAVPFVLPRGGVRELYSEYLATMGDNARLVPAFSLGDSWFLWWDYAFLLIFGGIPWHVYFQRVLSSKDEYTAKWLSIGAGGLCLLAATPAVLIGMVSATADWNSLGVEPPANSAIALPHVLKNLAPAAIATVSLGALAAAVMSSVDSSILSASSMGVWNVYRPLFARKDEQGRLADPAQLQRVIGRLIWIVGTAATLVALRVQSVYVLWFLCSDFVYCVLFPQLVTALFDKKANSMGSFVGFVIALTLRLGGGETALGLPRWIDYPMVDADGVVNFPFRTFSMICSLAAVVVVSRMTHSMFPPRDLVPRVDCSSVR